MIFHEINIIRSDLIKLENLLDNFPYKENILSGKINLDTINTTIELIFRTKLIKLDSLGNLPEIRKQQFPNIVDILIYLETIEYISVLSLNSELGKVTNKIGTESWADIKIVFSILY